MVLARARSPLRASVWRSRVKPDSFSAVTQQANFPPLTRPPRPLPQAHSPEQVAEAPPPTEEAAAGAAGAAVPALPPAVLAEAARPEVEAAVVLLPWAAEEVAAAGEPRREPQGASWMRLKSVLAHRAAYCRLRSTLAPD